MRSEAPPLAGAPAPPANPRLFTVGAIARRVGAPVHQVDYVLKSRRIPEAMRVGRLRTYEEPTVDRVRQELSGIAARRAATPGVAARQV